MSINPDISLLQEQRIMVIIRHNGPFNLEGLFESILSMGLKTIEITLNTPNAAKLIAQAASSFGSEIFLGAGTVLSVDEVKKARDAGARFMVSPILNLEMVEYCAKEEIPVFPGAATPTEIYTAYQAGASMVKLFPASQFGPSYIKAVKATLSHIPIIAVGGVNANTVNDYFSAGVGAVAIGTSTVKPEWVESENFRAIKDNIRNFTDAISAP
ncbi:MAG: bifunctional 4-hydroxy-2-oxoglutarate aldolase/2-dehydro-3-deoxy-phosphogluconate aldolase [bacterium]|nr:bifunctional 4-hydroxy-2-oxoglutarate aldolase/2-dehydro-3-deoxy-phosphogluconate aldolase [bacterium]